MKTFTALVAAGASWLVPAHAHHIQVFDHGHALIRMADPAYDTCNRQVAYVRSHTDQRTLAELVWCFTPHGEVENWTHHRLTIKYR